ncbi:M56 family peptidase [Parabacteroides sp. 52]|uniref:M56 family metallopeptidase n=1 Tax=unclassified Parabacteroides TaxID=2649774 RepID=UPI0013D36722|nr:MULTISPECIES: M56 family metallopeptidase [unclassified Parabacteroides]MDH6535490.1 TonB-dependent SusC/RagA subfamily outer membrane receptor [Parabacteroides sp. PM5-20]NDV55930.1 M56 family peptidase [Parabacteroides sp. 52]
METFGIYSLKVGLILLVFGSIYQCCLRRESFHRFNRFFLLTGIMAALFLPLIDVHYPVEEMAPSLSVVPSVLPLSSPSYVPETVSEKTDNPFLFNDLLWVIYFLGVSVLLIYRFIGLSRLYAVIRTYGYQKLNNYHLVKSPAFDASFSFFRFLFLPDTLIQANEEEMIVKHEEAHIRQCHWFDLLLTNILQIVWWFNPFVWFYEKAVRENHEYLADNAVLNKYNRADYLSVMVNLWLKTPVFPLVNSFSYSNQLKRIKMMNKNNSHPLKKLFALLILPALALFFWAFAEPEYTVTHAETSLQKKTSPVSLTITPEKDTLTNSVVIGGKKMKLHKPLLVVDGKEVSHSFQDIKAEEIASLSVLKEHLATHLYGEKAANGVILITTKKGEQSPSEELTAILEKMDESLIKIQGKVTSESGEKIIGANVVTKDSPRGTVTDLDGNFILHVEPNAIIEVSHIGYQKSPFKVEENKQKYTIQLKAK